MPRTKKKPAPKAVPSVAANGPGGEVLTLAEAAAYLRVSESELVALVQSQGLPGRLIGTEWRFLKSAIQYWLSTPASTTSTRKQAQLSLSGKYRDDPDLMRICEEAYQQRGHPMSEEE